MNMNEQIIEPTVENNDLGAARFGESFSREKIEAMVDRKIALPSARPDSDDFGHVRETRCLRQNENNCSCLTCAAYVCSRCGGIYGAGLTTHCPGAALSPEVALATCTAMLDYTIQRGWHIGRDASQRDPAFWPQDGRFVGGHARMKISD